MMSNHYQAVRIMEDKKYQIFVSSTYTDLKEVRDNLFKTILNLYHFPVGMEMFSAGDSDQWDIIQETISVSDYYVLVIGHRYGSLSKEGISYTEKEYNYAVKRKIPVLAYIRNRDIATKSEERDTDPILTAKLENFIKKAKTGKMCEFWTTPDELAKQIAIALPKTFRKMPKLGWVRGRNDNSQEVLTELARLSAENSELREKLKNISDVASPIIEVIIDMPNDGHLTLLKQENINPEPMPAAIEYDGMRHRSKFEVDEYNEKIPSIEQYQDYINDLYRFKSVKTNTIPLVIAVCNTGNQKASEVHVKIVIPDFLEIISKSQIEYVYDPIFMVEEPPFDRLAGDQDFNTRITRMFRNAKSKKPTQEPMDLTRTVKQRDDHQLNIDGNGITIYRKNLMHTQTAKFGLDDYFLLPRRVGTGVISVTAICEQHKTTTSYEISISVS